MSVTRFRYTKLCVYCLKAKAVSWCGHVLRDKEHILAGWCKRCESTKLGFVGHYKKKMKAMKETAI